MKLNANSLNAKLYCWFYGQRTHQLPNNLCPYFWKLVLAWFLLVPYALFSLPVILVQEVFDKSYENGDNKFGERLGISAIIYIFLFALFVLCVGAGALFTTYAKGGLFANMLPGAIMLWFGLTGVGIYHGIMYLIQKIREPKIVYDNDGYRVYPEKKSNLVVEFVKAKYNRYCPKIDWTNKN